MASESEVLLRAAARVFAEEGGDRSQELGQEALVIHVTIKGLRSWNLSTSGCVSEASPPEVSRARLHLTYASEAVFLGLAHK